MSQSVVTGGKSACRFFLYYYQGKPYRVNERTIVADLLSAVINYVLIRSQ